MFGLEGVEGLGCCDVAGFPSAVVAPLLDAFVECEPAAGASVGGGGVGGGEDLFATVAVVSRVSWCVAPVHKYLMVVGDSISYVCWVGRYGWVCR